MSASSGSSGGAGFDDSTLSTSVERDAERVVERAEERVGDLVRDTERIARLGVDLRVGVDFGFDLSSLTSLFNTRDSLAVFNVTSFVAVVSTPRT